MWTYVPSDVDANILGITIEGWADGEFINISPESPSFTFKRAMDGTTQATLNKFQTYSVKFTLHQSSPSNTWLHLVYKLFRRYGLAFAMPLLIRDKSGSTTFFATDVWIEKEPDSSFGTSLGTSTWEFRCNNASYTKGGNGDNSLVVEIISAVTAAITIAGNLGVDLGEFQGILEQTVESAIGSFGGIL